MELTEAQEAELRDVALKVIGGLGYQHGRMVLAALREIERLRKLCYSLGERIDAQKELLEKKAEKTTTYIAPFTWED